MAWNYELNTKLGPLCFTFTKFCILSKLLTYFEDNWIFLCFGSKLTEDFKVFKNVKKVCFMPEEKDVGHATKYKVLYVRAVGTQGNMVAITPPPKTNFGRNRSKDFLDQMAFYY